MSETSSRPRLAVVGYGFAGRSFHSYLIGLVPGLELRGVVSRNEDTRRKVAAERPGCRTYTELAEALGCREVDAVVIASPHDTHHPYALAALAAGKHVITDKPMCLTRKQAEEIYAAAGKAGREVLVFHNRRWDSEYLTLKKLLAEGALGDCRWIEMAWNRFGTWKSWRAKASSGGGRLYDLGSHMLDQLLTLFPQPVESVFARAHFDFPDTDTPSHCQVTVVFTGGKTGVIDCTSMSRFEKPRMLAYGPGGTFVKFGVDPQEAAMIKGDIDSAVVPPSEWPRLTTAEGTRMVPPIPGRWRSFYEHVERVLRGSEKPVITRNQMLRLMTVLDAAHESIRSGAVVRLPSALTSGE
jgi:predicted dehydrogenase